MAIPSIPSGFVVQQGDSKVFLSWNIIAGATSYKVQRSTDGVTFTDLATPATNEYLDESAIVATKYYYQVASVSASGTSGYASPQAIIPCAIGMECLGNMRLYAQQRSDMVNNPFIGTAEWNKYLTESYKELYDILIQKYGDDYYLALPYSFVTSGSDQFYDFPPDLYKLLGVEVALNPNDPNSWVSLRKFNFIQRNLWNYPNVYTFRGVTNLRYRPMGSKLQLVPQTQAGQTIRIWYAPRPVTLIQDTTMIDGISGWEEYIVVDAAIKALVKQEWEVDVLMAQKEALLKRIESAAENRDAGEPNTVSDSKMRNLAWTDDSGYGPGYGGTS